MSRPRGVAACANQSKREDFFEVAATKSVPSSAPVSDIETFSSEVNNIGMPAPVEMRAASIFVTIPPLPTLEPAPPISAPATSSILSTRRIFFAPGCDGGASYNPSTSDTSTNKSAPTRCETRAAMRSLSPKRISWVPTESFSLMIGTTPSWSSLKSVRCAF